MRPPTPVPVTRDPVAPRGKSHSGTESLCTKVGTGLQGRVPPHYQPGRNRKNPTLSSIGSKGAGRGLCLTGPLSKRQVHSPTGGGLASLVVTWYFVECCQLSLDTRVQGLAGSHGIAKLYLLYILVNIGALSARSRGLRHIRVYPRGEAPSFPVWSKSVLPSE